MSDFVLVNGKSCKMTFIERYIKIGHIEID